MFRQLILIGTGKCAWVCESDNQRGTWRITGPRNLGSVVCHYVADPRHAVR